MSPCECPGAAPRGPAHRPRPAAPARSPGQLTDYREQTIFIPEPEPALHTALTELYLHYITSSLIDPRTF